MNELTWKYVKPLKNPDAVTQFLKENSIILPSGLISCIVQNNGGHPSSKLFNTDKRKEYVFKSLLSYNTEDSDNIYTVYPKLFENTSLYPIGIDASGNFVCFDYSEQKYILFNHETASKEKILYNF